MYMMHMMYALYMVYHIHTGEYLVTICTKSCKTIYNATIPINKNTVLCQISLLSDVGLCPFTISISDPEAVSTLKLSAASWIMSSLV